jgi:tetratricopeptide (TPR) repeat protein
MAGENAFDKKLTAETNMDKVEGLLEHLNLPPKVIDFIRLNQRLIQAGIAVIVIAVVFWSLYGSYRERIEAEASSALSLALQAEPTAQADALRAVADKYSSTPSALWARIELGHLDMKNGATEDASQKYREILSEVKASNPVYPLIVFSLAQSLEAGKHYQDAFGQYDLLKGIVGFEPIAYAGMARLEETQGNIDKAIAVYNNFLLAMGDNPSFSRIQEEINAQIARLKARQ